MATGRIHKLDETSINRIGAGEVIQRPVNIVKELLENALDAGSESVHISVRNGGFHTVQVVDTGAGIRVGRSPR